MADWKLISPSNSPVPYDELAKKWMQWLVNPDPDRHIVHNRRFIFLRGVDMGEPPSQYYRVGPDRLQLCKNQKFLFFPAIMYFVDTHFHGMEEGELVDRIENLMAGGRAPHPENVTINDVGVFPSGDNSEDYRLITGHFDLSVPDPASAYGQRVLGPRLDVRLDQQAITKCVVGGYFALVKFEDFSKPYFLRSTGTGESSYHTDSGVEIEFKNCRDSDIEDLDRKNESGLKLARILSGKFKSGEITTKQMEEIAKMGVPLEKKAVGSNSKSEPIWGPIE